MFACWPPGPEERLAAQLDLLDRDEGAAAEVKSFLHDVSGSQSARRSSRAAMTTQRAAKPSWSARSPTRVREDDAREDAGDRERAQREADADVDVVVAELPPGAGDRHRDDDQEGGGLRLDLARVEQDHQRRHEEDAAADAEQTAERAPGERDQHRERDVHHGTASSIATAMSSSAKRSETVRSEIRC